MLNSAFELFTTKGVSKTSIAEISSKAGMAKGTFYLYFKDKFDIRNRLISHESSLLFSSAVAALDKELEKRSLNFTEKIIFLIDNIINALDSNKTLLNFISNSSRWRTLAVYLLFQGSIILANGRIGSVVSSVYY